MENKKEIAKMVYEIPICDMNEIFANYDVIKSFCEMKIKKTKSPHTRCYYYEVLESANKYMDIITENSDPANSYSINVTLKFSNSDVMKLKEHLERFIRVFHKKMMNAGGTWIGCMHYAIYADVFNAALKTMEILNNAGIIKDFVNPNIIGFKGFKD